MIRTLLLVLLFATRLAASDGSYDLEARWTSRLRIDHPLVGKVWSASSSEFVAPQQLADTMAEAPFALLGETHDNPDHHRLQAWVVGEILRRERHPRVVLEMLDSDQARALKRYQANPSRDAAGFGAAVGWPSSGWPAWEMYRPIATAAYAGGVPLAWGNLPKKTVRKVGMQGLGVLQPGEAERMKVTQPLAAALQAALEKEIDEGHCGMLPPQALAPIALAQRVRDATFADRMLAVGRDTGAVLIAGGGHVRRDRAVPWYLARRAPGMTYRTLVLVEVEDGKDRIEDYMPAFPDGRPASDFLWFTPAAERADPCAKFQKHMAKKK